MTESDETQEQQSSTSPPEGDPSEATSPPSNPETDQDALDRGQEKLDQAGGGH